ncbi:hypothetical protein L195_g023618 [Trifolium pratense]|uniref:Uncharacterized protein n=1 Tax=Trifolium pratense TaxID=57577 RepID=A0A2K3NBB9_TRIPR|nr:hypothetical protein L195_g023618 [Trifolium pratense]
MDPYVEEKFKVLEDAIGTQRADHQNLEGKVDALHDKFDELLALLGPKP